MRDRTGAGERRLGEFETRRWGGEIRRGQEKGVRPTKRGGKERKYTEEMGEKGEKREGGGREGEG